MFAATRRWFRRNKTPIAIGLGVVGAGYIATQYILGKLNDARERMSSDRIAKEKCAPPPPPSHPSHTPVLSPFYHPSHHRCCGIAHQS